MNSRACSEAVAKFNCFGRSFIKEIMTWNWKSAAAISPYSEFSQCKSFNEAILGAILIFFLLVRILNVWLTNKYIHCTTTNGKATIEVKDKPSLVTKLPTCSKYKFNFTIKLRNIYQSYSRSSWNCKMNSGCLI